jgi:hypothetical protein
MCKSSMLCKEEWFKKSETSSEGTMWKHNKLLYSFATDRKIRSDCDVQLCQELDAKI